MPIGVTVPFAGAIAPTGWRICDGSPVSSTNYLTLHSIISNNYGGSVYTGAAGLLFNLPNLKQRIPVGLDAASGFNPLGYTSGAKDHLLTSNESGLVGHTHTTVPHQHNYSATGSGSYATGNASDLLGEYGTTTSMETVTVNPISSASALSAHNNMQPYIIMNYIIFTG